MVKLNRKIFVISWISIIIIAGSLGMFLSDEPSPYEKIESGDVNLPPSLVINSPSNLAIIHTNPMVVAASASDSDGTIATVHFQLYNASWNSGWIDIPFLSGISYRKYYDIGLIETGDYNLKAEAIDNEASGVTKIISISISLKYYIDMPKTNITYTSDNVEMGNGVSSTQSGDRVEARCTVYQNSTIKNTEMILDLDDEFTDAADYNIYRTVMTEDGLVNRIYPPQDFGMTDITDWTFLEYAAMDIVHFSVRMPYISQTFDSEEVEYADGLVRYSQVFEIHSNHAFTNINASFSPRYGYNTQFNFTLNLRVAGEWVEQDLDAIHFQAIEDFQQAQVTFYFMIDSMNVQDTLRYEIVMYQQAAASTNMLPYFYAGLIASVYFVVLLFATNKSKDQTGSFWNNLGRGYWLLTIGTSVAVFAVAYFITSAFL